MFVNINIRQCILSVLLLRMLLFLVLILPILYIVFECYAVKRHYDEVLSLETKPLVKVVIDHELMRWWKSGKSNITEVSPVLKFP